MKMSYCHQIFRFGPSKQYMSKKFKEPQGKGKKDILKQINKKRNEKS